MVVKAISKIQEDPYESVENFADWVAPELRSNLDVCETFFVEGGSEFFQDVPDAAKGNESLGFSQLSIVSPMIT